jgi:uncharacterized membrane protein YiaA
MKDITTTDQLARAGYFARAIVYGLLGYLALTSGAAADEGPNAAFDMLEDIPAGEVVLALLAIGLVAYGLYKFATAALDLDGKGAKAAGIAKRVGMAFGALAYLFMAFAAYRILTGSKAGGNRSRETAETVLQMPLGDLLLGAVGLGFILAAALQLRSAWNRHFMRMIDPDAPRFTCTIGRIGLAARSIVFGIVGVSLLRAAWTRDEGEVRDLGGVLGGLRGDEPLYLSISLGLVVFAIYSAIEARYRIVPRVDVVDTAKRKAARAAA